MKIKNLIEKLNKFNKNAEILFVYPSNKKLKGTYKAEIEYNQILEENHIVQNEDLVLINL